MVTADHNRLQRIQEALCTYDLDALVLFHTDNVLMATGMFPGSTHVVALVTSEKHVVIITPWWRDRFVREESWANEVLSYDWCRGFNGVEPTSAIIGLLRKLRESIGLEKIGYDARMHHYNPTKIPSEFFTYEEIKSKLPEIFGIVKDATELINQLKSVKTPREVEKLRLANTVARAGVQAFYKTATVGMKETDVAAKVNYAILKMAGQQGIRYTYCDPPQITSGPERTAIADTLSNHATERELREADTVMLEFGVLADGYWADITRNLVVGGPREDHLRMHRAILQAQQDAIAAYVPYQSTGHELCEVAWEAMRSAGFREGITHSLGHGLGFAYHEDRPILGPGERATIRPGHVTSLEPGLYWKHVGSFVGGIRVEDNVVWGERPGQVEILSKYYRGLDPKEW